MSVRRSATRGEAGLTLIELMIAVVLLGIIFVPLTEAMTTGLITTTEAQQRLAASRSPMFANAFFADDAQSAAIDGITTGGSPVCGSGTNVVSFSWTENGTPYSASYILQTSGGLRQLVRNYCSNGGGAQPATLAISLGSPDPFVLCLPGRGAASKPRTIVLTARKPNGDVWQLQGTRRAT